MSSTCEYCEQPSQYACPRCSIRYCSLECYKSEQHAACSEEFYKEQVMRELKEMKGSDEEKKRMIESLKKLSAMDRVDGAGDDDGDDELSARLAGVNLDDTDELWGRLSAEEKNKFTEGIKNGKVGWVPMWKPWWLEAQAAKTSIVTVDLSTNEEPAAKKRKVQAPKLINKLPSMSALSVNVDDRVAFNIVSVIASYAYVQRLYNGELFADSMEDCLNVILSFCSVLNSNAVYNDLDMCLCEFVSTVQQDKNLCTFVDPVELTLTDVAAICESEGNFAAKVLSDVHRFLKHCKQSCSNDLRKRLFFILKKVVFLVAFAYENAAIFKGMVKEIRCIQAKCLSDIEEMKSERKVVENSCIRVLKRKEGPLIVEV